MYAHPKTRFEPTPVALDTFLIHDHHGEGEAPISVALAPPAHLGADSLDHASGRAQS